jgi:hypothetical protein
MGITLRRLTIFALVFALVQLVGCDQSPQSVVTIGGHAPSDAVRGVNVLVYDGSLDGYAAGWKEELERRFHDKAVAILCHGGGPEADHWLLADNPGGGYGTMAEPAEALVDRVHAEYPDCTVILLACNPSHYSVHGRPWLYYSPDSVWCVPDRAVKPFDSTGNAPFDHIPAATQPVEPHYDLMDNRSVSEPGIVGNAYEFVEAN